MFERKNAPVTLFACALALERNPPMAEKVKALLAKDIADICCHGWRCVRRAHPAGWPLLSWTLRHAAGHASPVLVNAGCTFC